jgi:O-antigen ligase
MLHIARIMCIGAVFIFVPFWFRLSPYGVLPRNPYFLGFAILIPAVGAILFWLLGKPELFRHRGWLFAVGLLCVWYVLSARSTIYRVPASHYALQFGVVILFALACMDVKAKYIVAAFTIGVLIQSVIVITQFTAQRPVGLHLLGETTLTAADRGASVVVSGDSRLMRPYGMTVHPNVIGGYLVVGVLAQIPLLGERRWHTWARYAVFVLGVWAILCTFSRSAWGGLLIGVGVFVAWQFFRRLRFPFLPVGLISVLTAAFFLIYSPYIAARAGAGTEPTELLSVAQRGVFINIAWQLWQRDPMRGVGIGVFQYAAQPVLARSDYATLLKVENVHSVPLLALSETGIIGAALWLLVVGLGLWCTVWYSVRRGDMHSVGLVAGAVALLAIGLLDHYYWTLFPLMLLFWGLVSPKTATQAPIETTNLAKPDTPAA